MMGARERVALDDDRVRDPEFLAAAAPGAVLAQRERLRTAAGRRALAAFELSMGDWERCSQRERRDRLAANAARVGAGDLLAACEPAGRWPIRWAAWSGYVSRRLDAHGSVVTAVAAGRAGGRDLIVSGCHDGMLGTWDAVTGERQAARLAGHGDRVGAVAAATVGTAT